MRKALVAVFLLAALLALTGCGLLPWRKGGGLADLAPPTPLNEEGYGGLQLVATISGEFMPSPSGVAVDEHGFLYVTDDIRQTVLVFRASDLSAPAREIGAEGSGPGQFIHPREIVLADDGALYILDDGNSRVQKLSAAGEPLAVYGRRQDFSPYFSLQDGYDEPLSALAVDGEGNVYVGLSGANYDISPHGLVKFSAAGEKLWEIRSTLEGEIDLLPFAWPNGLTVAADGTIYLAHGANGVGKIMALPQVDGQPTKAGARHFAFIGKGPGELMHTPGALLRYSDCELLVADTYNNRLQLFTSDGALTAMYHLQGLSTAEFDQPTALALAPDGCVFVVDRGNRRVLKVRLAPPAIHIPAG